MVLIIRKANSIRIILFFLFLAFATFSANAGFITIETKTTTTLEDALLTVRVETTNNGNEPAYNVEISADVQGNIKASVIKDILNIGEAHKAAMDFNLSLTKPGRYPLVITVDYTDANQYPFSAISCSLFTYKTKVAPQVFAKSMKLTMSNRGKLTINAKNLDEKDKTLNIRLIIPREISSNAILKETMLEGRTEKEITFNINNFSALPGSNYQVFAILEYDEKDKHYSTVVSGIVTIEEEGIFSQNYRIFIIVIAVILVLLFLFYQFRPKAEA